MKPRKSAYGNLAGLLVEAVLQWGRGDEAPEIGGRVRYIGTRYHLLQWGRGDEAPEITKSSSRGSLGTGRCFNEAGAMKPRKS